MFDERRKRLTISREKTFDQTGFFAGQRDLLFRICIMGAEPRRPLRSDDMTVPVFVFGKPPFQGKSKTRLAAGIGSAAAADLARAFLQDTFALLEIAGAHATLATTDPEADHGLPGRVPRVQQGEGSLGDRLTRVLGPAIARHGAAIALGADSPGLPPQRLLEVVDGLAHTDAVFIPAADGGFVAMGVRRLEPGWLDDVPWSTDRALDATIERLGAHGTTALVSPWFDIDHEEDLRRFRADVPRERAPHTWAVLDALA